MLCIGVACAPGGELATTTSGAPAPTTTIVNTSSSSATGSNDTTTSTSSTLQPLKGLTYEAVGSVDFPVQIVARPGEAIAYVILKSGLVLTMEDGEIDSEPVLDISDRVRDSGEQGLLSIALSEDPGLMYLHYSDQSGNTVVSEFAFSDERTVDPESERVLLRVDQPAANHNGGMIQVVDGVLYVGLGDGGGANDGFGNGQNTDTLLGGLVALSVTEDPDPYLFSYGLRNPWRFQIDDGLIYVADVGQDSYEEVSVTELAEGTNFGWPITEGKHCFNPAEGCDPSGTVLPIIEVGHDDSGTCSITGGPVYHGEEIPELDGAYLYSDYCGGYLRSFRYVDGEAVDQKDWTEDVGVPGRVTGFGIDGSGEMYVLTDVGVLRLAPSR